MKYVLLSIFGDRHSAEEMRERLWGLLKELWRDDCIVGEETGSVCYLGDLLGSEG